MRDIDIYITSNPKPNFKELLDLNAEIKLELGVQWTWLNWKLCPKTFKQTY